MKKKVEMVATGARVFDIHLYHGDITARATEQESWEFEWFIRNTRSPPTVWIWWSMKPWSSRSNRSPSFRNRLDGRSTTT